MADTELLIGGFPVRTTEPLKNGDVLTLVITRNEEQREGEWRNVPSTQLEIAVCGKTTSPDVSPTQSGQQLVFNTDDNVWQPGDLL